MRPRSSAGGMICDFAPVHDMLRKAERRVKSHFAAFLARRDVLWQHGTHSGLN